MGLLIDPHPTTLNASNIAVSTLNEWNVATPYTEGAQVKVSKQADGVTALVPVREYQATAASTGAYPPGSVNAWAHMGAQNRERILDGYNNSRTIAAAGQSIEFTITPSGRARYLYLIGLRNAVYVTIEEEIGGSVVSTLERDLMGTYSQTGPEAWLYDIDEVDRFYLRSAAFALPSRAYQPRLNITIRSGAQPAECGQCLVGTGFYLGETRFSAAPGLRDWSTFDQNSFGITEHTPRTTTRTLRGTLRISSHEYDRVFQLFESRMQKLALFDFNNKLDGDYTFDAMRVYGKLDSFDGPIEYGYSDINMTIRGTE